MKSVFRLYAKTSRGNDDFLFNELRAMGLKPKHQDLLHSFYFDATFHDIMRLSFNSYTAENLYMQLGHKYPLYIPGAMQPGDNERLVSEFLRKINFRNYLPVQRNLVENITLKLIIRESTQNLASESVILSLLQNHLRKEAIMKEYRGMFRGAEEHSRLENYYEIKQIVDKKWEHQDCRRDEIKALLSGPSQTQRSRLEDKSTSQNATAIQASQALVQEFHQLNKSLKIPYAPHLIMYVRRNHARMLLKLNKDSMHKFGWKQNIGWAPVRETLAASILYRSGLLAKIQQQQNVKLWDPFCGSGTLPLVAYSLSKNYPLRKDIQKSFIWQKLPIFNQSYLDDFFRASNEQASRVNLRVLASDIDISAVNNTVENFKNILRSNPSQASTSSEEGSGTQEFLKLSPSDQIYELVNGSVYVGCGDFEQLAPKILNDAQDKVNIIANLPYVGQRSKEHLSIKQLNSVYRRFGQMVHKYKDYIENIFILVDSQTDNHNHFINVAGQEWRIIEYFSNGGIKVCLLGWAGNTCGLAKHTIVESQQEKGKLAQLTGQRAQNLQEYRSRVKEIESKNYDLPAHQLKSKGMRSVRRVRQKIKERHLRAAYVVFAKRRDKEIAYRSLARKNLMLRLSKRGITWKKRNSAILAGQLLKHEDLIKKQFEGRVEQALRRSEALKERRTKPKAVRKW